MNRVVVTGLGCITPLGKGKEVFFANLVEGVDGIDTAQAFDVSSYPFKTAGEVRGFESGRLPRSTNDRAARLLSQATAGALSDAALPLERLDPRRVALITGTTLGGMLSGEAYYRELSGDPARVHPGHVVAAGQFSSNDVVMSHYGLQGPSMVISTACSASSHAIGYGLELLSAGLVDAVLAGGFEPMSEITFSGFGILRAITTDKIRPFDKQRSGLVLGEGAAILVLEREADARRRAARIYARLAGYGSSSDAYHMTAPHRDGAGAARAMTLSLRDAGLAPDEVDYINAHGTATRANDVAETRAIKNVFGEHAYRVPVSSIKSMIGHTLGAAGAIEAAATALSVFHDAVPPTINYRTRDPECDLDYVPNEGRDHMVRAALSSSFGFGGNNAVLAFSKAE